MLAKASKNHAANRKPYNQLKKEFDLDTKRDLKFVEICRKDIVRINRNERVVRKKEKRVEKQLQKEVLKTFDNMKGKSRM